MKKILLVGAVYSDNLGDGVICQTMGHLLSSFAEVVILDIYGRRDYIQSSSISRQNLKEQFRKSVIKIRTRNTILSLGIWPNTVGKRKKISSFSETVKSVIEDLEISAIVFAGGALLKGVFLDYIDQILKLNLQHVPVIFNSCGIDAEMLPVEWKKAMVILASPDVKKITLRDGIEEVHKKLPLLQITDAADPAVTASKIFSSAKTKHGIGVGIMLSHKIPFETQVSFWKRMLHYLDKDEENWYIFTNGSFEDYAFAEYLVNECGIPEEKLISRPTRPEELYTIISGFESILSMRLHSLILAYAAGVPAVAISWDKKIDTFFHKIDRDDYCFSMKNDMDVICSALFRAKKAVYNQTVKESLTRMVMNSIQSIGEII